MTPLDLLKMLLASPNAKMIAEEYEPTKEELEARVQELVAMGLSDTPLHPRVASSTRQYARCTLNYEKGVVPEDELFVFGTLDPAILAMADRLAERYGPRPKSIHDIVKEEGL